MKGAPMASILVHRVSPTDWRKLVPWSNLLRLWETRSVLSPYDSGQHRISIAVKRLRWGTKAMISIGRIHRVALVVFTVLVFCADSGWSQGYERRVEASRDFTTATNPLGWSW